jgi:hypothetical protein
LLCDGNVHIFKGHYSMTEDAVASASGETHVTKKRKRNNYVDNATFTQELMNIIPAAKQADENGEKRPPVSNFVAKAFMDIAKGVGSRPNFAGYPYRDDMVMDGVENCLLYYTNFDPTKQKGKPNPHAYFTQIVWFAFLRRIKREKKEQYIKFKSSQELIALGETSDNNEIRMNLSTDVDYINKFIEDFETKMTEENERSKKSSGKDEEVTTNEETQDVE